MMQSKALIPSVEQIWDRISTDVLSLTGRIPERREKLRLVFPKRFCEEAFSRSPSYLSWFLHRTPQARPLRERLFALFLEEPSQCLREMTDRCFRLVYEKGTQSIQAKILLSLVEDFSRSLPRAFGKGTKGYHFLEALCFRAPAKSLALLFLMSGVGEKLEDICQKAELYWQGVPGTDEASLQDLFQLALSNLRSGQKADAFGLLREIVGQKSGDPRLLGEAHALLGDLYRFGAGGKPDPEKARSHYILAVDYANYDACFPLFCLSEDTDPEEAKKWLFLGAAREERNCQYALGKAYYEGNAFAGGERNLIEAEKYLTAAAEDARKENPADFGLRSRGVAAAQYLLSRLLMEKKTAEADELAMLNLVKAAKNGSEEAEKALLDSLLLGTPASPKSKTPFRSTQKTARGGLGEPPEAGRCAERADDGFTAGGRDRRPRQFIFANALTAQTLHLLETLPDPDANTVLCGQPSDLHLPEGLTGRNVRADPRDVASALAGLLGKPSLPRITFLLLKEDGLLNIAEAGKLLAQLRDLMRETSLIELVQKVRIFIRADQQSHAALTDSLLNQYSPFFVPLILLDPGKNAAEQLLDRYPLFLPLLSEHAPAAVHVAFMGSGPSIPWLLKDTLTLIGNPQIPFTLSVISKDSSLEETFYAECPSYADAAIAIPRVHPQFFSECKRLDLLLAQRSPEEAESSGTPSQNRQSVPAPALAAVLGADYFVIDTGNDLRNLSLGMRLRERFLQRDLTYTSFPCIAIYCADPQIASLADTLTAGSESFGFSWHNNYNIIVYGPGSRLGDWEHVIENRLEKRARALHLRYFNIRDRVSDENNPVEAAREHRNASGASAALSDEKAAAALALRFYYARQYHQDSSLMAALYASYALAENGIFWPSPEMYALLSNQKPLAERYLDRFGAETTELALEREHDRWVRFMMTRGWRRASCQQVLAYIEKGCPRTQLHIARLHPLLCSWEELGDQEPSPTGMQAFYEYILPRLSPGKKVPSLKEYDLANVEAIPELLSIF